ncbi:MAG: carbonic anhydrase [Acidobacteriota bacterium]
MCRRCDETILAGGSSVGRRTFLGLAAAAAASLALPRVGFAAASSKPPPKPQNVLTPDQALQRLMKGNARYVEGVAARHDFKHEREALSKGQNPYAGILSCADSRIVPEYTFDSGRGDLFVCRVAGNFLNDDAIASFEYGVAVLGVPLLMVLGHKSCGAVDAAIKSIKDGTTLPGHLPSLVTALTPAVKAGMAQPGNALDNAIRENVVRNVEKMKTATPIIDKAVTEKKVRVVGGVYNLDSGKVEMVG